MFPCLRFDNRDAQRTQGPKRQAEGNPQNHRENDAKFSSCCLKGARVHGVLLSNRYSCLTKFSFSFVASLVPYFPASFSSAGRVARCAAPVWKQPVAKGIKRGGACLFAQGYSSSDANRATHRGIGRRF
jgi:hypothetical protein